ncbi:hypothetical protein DP038_25460, partial [Escherichia coli]|nr:hypothetical protein [Escherichia coli O19]EFO2250780.1 hypothetical protein [Escherichia coli]
GLTTGFPCHFQCFHGKPAVRRERHGPALVFLRTGREQRRGTPSAYPSRYRSHHRTTPDLVPLRRTVAQDDSG